MSESNQQYEPSTAIRTISVALRMAHHQFKDGSGEKAPKKLTLPSGVDAGRVAIAGVVTTVEDVGNGSEFFKATIYDGFKAVREAPEDVDREVNTYGGRVNMYAGQYQPDAKAMLDSLEPPAYVFAVGKPRTYEPEGEDGPTIVSLQAEEVNVVTEEEVLAVQHSAAEQTMDRLESLEQRVAADDEDAKRAVSHHTDIDRELVLDGVMTGLEALQEQVADVEADADTISADTLEAMDYNELRSLAGNVDDVNGNQGRDELVNALAGMPQDILPEASA